MTDNQSPFQLGHPEYIVPRPATPDTPPDPPRNRLVRLWHNPPRRAFLVALVLVIGVLVAVYVLRDDDDEALPVKDFDLAAAVLDVEPVAAWHVHDLSGAALRLPGRFEVLDVDPAVLMDAGMGVLGPEWDPYTDAAAEHLSFVQLYFDRVDGLQGGVIAYVMTMALDRRASAQQIVADLERTSFPRGVRTIDVTVVVLDGVEVARWIIDIEAADFGSGMRVAQYTIIDNDTRTAWLLYCISPTNTFEDWLAIFQAAARTFTVIPTD